MANDRLYSFRELISNGVVREDANGITVQPISMLRIPKLQRPYAQGRASQAELRSKFISDIFRALSDKSGEPLVLNFVYGSTDEDVFSILDGQQRLTTLFLLHWYLAMRSPEPELNLKDLAKFTYQTRTTSKDFIDRITRKPLTVDKKPSAVIEGQIWFTSAFRKDSTVMGMLAMLDEIHKQYESCGVKPGVDDLERLRFYLLELQKFGLTDELFIKMNARGLQLTPFENFKAELVGWLRDSKNYEDEAECDSKTMPYWLYFSSRMDGRWNDLFWTAPADFNPEDNDTDDLGAALSDRRFFIFIKRWLANRALTITSESKDVNDIEHFEYFSSRVAKDSYASFDKTRSFLEYAAAKSADIIRELAHTLEFYTDNHTNDVIKNAFTASWDNPDAAQYPWNDKFNMRQMIIFSAINEFVATQDSPAAFDCGEFPRWMRLVHNIVENRDIPDYKVQITLTRQLKTAIGFNPKSVYERFRDYANSLGDKQSREFREEVVKIDHILLDPDWENAFKEAEKDPFLTGSVTFCLVTEDGIDRYRERISRVPMLFNGRGVVAEFASDFTFVRALLKRDTDFSKDNLGAYARRITNSSANRFLKNRTIWNESVRVKNLFLELLDCDDVAAMLAHIDRVLQEPLEIVYPKALTDEDGQANMRNSISNLCSKDWPNPLGWLESVNKTPIGLWIGRDGRMELYYGNVNCMWLDGIREAFVNELKAAMDGYTIACDDDRQAVAYDNFGLYSGSSLTLRVNKEGEDEIILWIGSDLSLEVYFNEREKADRFSGAAATFSDERARFDPQGNLITWAPWGYQLYCGLEVKDIRQGHLAAHLANAIVQMQ